MQTEEHTSTVVRENRGVSAWEAFHWIVALIPPIMGGAVSLFSAYVAKSSVDGFAGRLAAFMLGLFVMALLITRASSLWDRRNRDVVLLKERLGEIYLAALRKSALNPHLNSQTPHDRA